MISHAGFDFARLCLVDGQLFRQLTEQPVVAMAAVVATVAALPL